MSGVTVSVSDKEASEALANPAFREMLNHGSIFKEIKDESGIDVFNYDSLKDYFFAYYSTLDTKVLEEYSRSSTNDPNETLEEVLKSRLENSASI